MGDPLKMTDRPKGWNDADEQRFRPWYAKAIEGRDLDPNPDSPEHRYNYRHAFKAGAWPGQDGHWPSEFKAADHPNRFVDGQDTTSGQPATLAQKVRATHPGVYDDLSDADLESKVRAKFPGVYDDIPSSTPPADVAAPGSSTDMG